MSGPYAHMVVINEFTLPRLQGLPGFPRRAISAVLEYTRYAELGSISPDFPDFDPLQSGWADDMHKKRTGKLLREGVALVASMSEDTAMQQKCLAWLLGYAAHVATDVTVHPVVQLKSKGSMTEHHRCELNQDAYIWDRLGVGEVGAAKHFVGVNQCFSGGSLDPDIEALWAEMLRRTYPEEWTAPHKPRFETWYRGFNAVVENIVTQGRAIPFGRHLLLQIGVLYPARGAIEQQYIQALEVPVGPPQSYDAIFDRAVASTGQVWIDVARGACEGDSTYQRSLQNWSLDTGRDEAGKLVFW